MATFIYIYYEINKYVKFLNFRTNLRNVALSTIKTFRDKHSTLKRFILEVSR